MIFIPGRIEVLGKHTDYAGGRSLVCATERGFRVHFERRGDELITVADAASGARIEMCREEGRRGALIVHHRPDTADTRAWANYPAAVVKRLALNFPDVRGGADIVFESDLPAAAGLSSSSALVIGVFLALSSASDLEAHPAYRAAISSREDLAGYLAAVENGSRFGELDGDEGVGTSGGSEDHTAILCCQRGAISQYRFAPIVFERTIELPAGLTLAIATSGVAAEKTGAARAQYNRAAETARRVLAAWQAAAGSADASLGDVVRESTEAAEWVRKVLTSADLRDRFDHFVEESEALVPAAGDALAARDLDRFGRLCDRSQDLAERLLRNQVPETVSLARIARERGAYAASSFGAGFGGSVWALVEESGAADFMDTWLHAYRAACPDASRHASAFATRPAGPAREI